MLGSGEKSTLELLMASLLQQLSPLQESSWVALCVHFLCPTLLSHPWAVRFSQPDPELAPVGLFRDPEL